MLSASARGHRFGKRVRPPSRVVRAPRLPADELPDLREAGALVAADVGEDGDGALEVLHRLLGATGLVEEVGEVVLERRLAVAVAQRDAERECLLREFERAWRIARLARDEREVVERRGARREVLGEREAALELR